jgi:hypothetical protein
MIIRLTALAACFLLALLTGCASAINGTHEDIAVTTTASGKDLAGAACQANNDRGEWKVTSPGTVNVHRSADSLTVTCTDTGYTSNAVVLEGQTSGAYWGNIVAGGLVGVVVDSSNGAAYKYPDHVTVPLTPLAPPVAAAAPAPTPASTKPTT